MDEIPVYRPAKRSSMEVASWVIALVVFLVGGFVGAVTLVAAYKDLPDTVSKISTGVGKLELRIAHLEERTSRLEAKGALPSPPPNTTRWPQLPHGVPPGPEGEALARLIVKLGDDLQKAASKIDDMVFRLAELERINAILRRELERGRGTNQEFSGQRSPPETLPDACMTPTHVGDAPAATEVAVRRKVCDFGGREAFFFDTHRDPNSFVIWELTQRRDMVCLINTWCLVNDELYVRPKSLTHGVVKFDATRSHPRP